MTSFTYSYPDDSLLAAGKPARAVDIRSIRDIGPAIAEGADGAPRVTDAALDTTATGDGANWVGNRAALIGAGGIGSMVFACGTSRSSSPGTVSFGATVAGSSLTPTDITNSVTSVTTLSGTWRCLGRAGVATDSGGSQSTYHWNATLWMRIS